MINKLYESMKQILKNNFKFLIILIILFLVTTLEFPYYIDCPGGLIDVSKRITIEDSYDVNGSFNLAYVTEMKATIPTLILSLFNKDWDILKKDEVISSNETIKEMEYRNHLLLEEANQNALIVGFNKANKEVSITDNKVYVIYVDTNALTDLKIGDQILKINNQIINTKSEMYDILNQYKENDTLEILVDNNGTQYKRKATLKKEKERAIIGLVVAETKKVTTALNVEFHFKPSESGPSGGFMTALSIYNYLTEKDITNGLKIVGTGTIDEFGNVGPIGGIEYKLKAAIKNKADIFFVPKDNEEEANEAIKNDNLKIKTVVVENIDDAIAYLNNL